MRVRGAELLSAGLLSALALGACGGGGGGGSRLTQEAFVTRVNATCDQANMRIRDGARDAFPEEGLVPTGQQLDTFVRKTVIPEVEREVAEMKKVKPPKYDQGRVDAIVDAGNNAVKEMQNLSASVQTSRNNPLRQYADTASGYGLNTCADIYDIVRREASGTRSKNP